MCLECGLRRGERSVILCTRYISCTVITEFCLSDKFLLALASTAIFGSEPRGTYCHILLSLIRDAPNLEDQVTIFISLSDRVAQLYLQVLGSLFIASFDSQGYNWGVLTRLRMGLSPTSGY
jgi:hypothetical protein